MSWLVKRLRRLTGSTFVLLLLFVICIDVLLIAMDPLNFLNKTGLTGLNHYYVVSKLPEFLSSKRRPRVILTGSSLWLHPAVRCDDRLNNRITRYDPAYTGNVIDTYSKSEYLEKQVARLHGSQCPIANLATAGGMMSDQFMVARKCLTTGIHPDVFVCDISPREFLDNNQTDHEKTPVYLVLRDYSSFYELVRAGKSLETIGDAALGSFWTYFRQKRDYKEFLVNFVARLTGHPTDMFHAVSQKNNQKQVSVKSLFDRLGIKEDIITQPRSGDLTDLKSYQQMYLPVNDANFQKQIVYLERLLELARKEKVKVLLVMMPLRKENLDLLPEEFRMQLHNRVSRLAHSYDAELMEASKVIDFHDNDFEDSAHLNASGGAKLFDAVAQKINRLLDQ